MHQNLGVRPWRKQMPRNLTDNELILVSGGASTSNNGFDSNNGQGNLDNDSSNNSTNNGTTTESGPKGVLKNDNTDNPNYIVDLPGANR
jgi:hypothetical protein